MVSLKRRRRREWFSYAEEKRTFLRLRRRCIPCNLENRRFDKLGKLSNRLGCFEISTPICFNMYLRKFLASARLNKKNAILFFHYWTWRECKMDDKIFVFRHFLMYSKSIWKVVWKIVFGIINFHCTANVNGYNHYKFFVWSFYIFRKKSEHEFIFFLPRNCNKNFRIFF